ncbi:sterol desaturase family protein [uncultured Roseibium sp.]|uniref:sterol desaturase family protein n=1 Tax=uncultured Roseibium sp. TaxID=1936171 RepID=UPI0026392CDA|nr:sterol desaturase family protein [uncultured Roseibium sp.]
MDFVGRIYEFFELLVTTRVYSVSFAATLAFAFAVLIFDLHRRGYRFNWPRRLIRSVGANVGFWWVNLLFAPIVFLTAGYVKQAYDTLGIPSIDEAVWSGIPWWLLVPFAAVCYDFADYWNHRILHHRWLWPIHAIHHSDPDLNVLTSYRIHFLESLVMTTSYILLLSWLGFPTDIMGYGAILLTLHNMYVHINVDWGHGPFKYVLASPRMHQWHHADLPEAYGKNLANVFPVFDLMFGTYYVPGPCKEPFGVHDVPQNDVVKLILYPFAEWSRQARAGLRTAFRSKSGTPDLPETEKPADPA